MSRAEQLARKALPATAPVDASVLTVDRVSISYGRGEQRPPAVQQVSLAMQSGEVLALVGESGSGKTSIANAVLGLLPPGGRVTSGRIEVLGSNIVGQPESALRKVRGSVVGLIPQDPLVSLNPTMRIGQQVGETVRLRGVPRRSVPAEVFEFLERAGIDDPRLRARQYPHELSGGIRQRALIANALAGHPKLIVADEPTSALDVTVQRRILDHLDRLVREQGIALLLITHDLAVAADRADRVMVLKRGRVVETGPSREVLVHPRDPYTRRMLAVAPGFSFRAVVSAQAAGVGRADISARPEPTASVRVPAAADGERSAVLSLENIVKDFRRRDAAKGAPRAVRVLDDVSLQVPAGRTLALVGESGRGKTTLMRIAMRLLNPTSGRVILDGTDITALRWGQLRPFRKRFQLVHQDPFSSLDPRLSIEESIIEPLVAYRVGSRVSRHARAVELLDQVALPASYLRRRPAELSGGQRQRVAIARALSLKPDLVMLDEPASALDVSVQAQILELLASLQRELGVAYLFITHDLAVVAQVAHEVAVLGEGKIAEAGPTQAVFQSPQSDFTRQLLDAIPGQRWQA